MDIPQPWCGILAFGTVLMATFFFASVRSRHSLQTTKTWIIGLGLSVCAAIQATGEGLLIESALMVLMAIVAGLDLLALHILKRTNPALVRRFQGLPPDEPLS
jgi:hypothetical protein